MSLRPSGPQAEDRFLGHIVGANVRRVRQDKQLTQDEVVVLWSSVGLDWPRTKLSALESGARRAVSLSDALLMAVALRLPVVELFRGEGQVRLSPHGAPVPVALLADWVAGGPADALAATLETHDRETLSSSQTADAEMADRLGVTADEVWSVAIQLFGVSVTEHRDRSVQAREPKTLAERTALRGHVTRQIEGEIVRELRRKGVLRD